MSRFRFDPEALTREVTELNRKLAEGLQTLASLPPVDVGQTPHEVIYREDKLALNYYPPKRDRRRKAQRPLLFVYALVNRPYILDLQPDRSLIRALTERGSSCLSD